MTLKYRAATAALAGLALAQVLPAIAATPPAWQAVARIPGIVDIGGPRADGWLVVMGSAKLWLVDPLGAATPYPGTYADDKGGEAYLTVIPAPAPGTASPSPSAGCSFQPGDLYILRLHAPLGITKVDVKGAKSTFAAIPNVTALNAIAFDTVGTFGGRLVVTGTASAGKSEVATVDCAGTVSVITRTGPPMEGGIVIAPKSFGAFAGMLIGPDELSGNIYAVGADGTSKTVVASGLPKGTDVGVEGVGFVPHGWHGNLYFADRVTKGNPHPGTDSLLQLTSDSLTSLGAQEGDLLSATEGGATLIDVRCSTSCTVQPLVTKATSAHGEGHLIFTGATPILPSPSPSPVAAKSPGSGEIAPQVAVAIAIVALVVLVATVVLVLLDLRQQRQG